LSRATKYDGSILTAPARFLGVVEPPHLVKLVAFVVEGLLVLGARGERLVMEGDGPRVVAPAGELGTGELEGFRAGEVKPGKPDSIYLPKGLTR
jgi:hypothetical protein